MTLPDTRGRGLRHPGSPQYAYVPPLAILRVRRGGQIGTRLSVRGSMTTIGSGDQADLQIVDPSLAPLHARLDLRQGIWTLTPLAAGASGLVDGEPVEGDTPLSPGSTIRLGEIDLLFEPRDPSEAERIRRAEQAGLPEVTTPSRPSPGRRAGFGIAVALGVLLILGGIALEFLS